MRGFIFGCVGLMIGMSVVRAGSQESSKAALDAGVKLVRDGAFEPGLLALDAVVRDLEARRGETAEKVQAHIYLGVAYVGLEQETAARRHFKIAADLDPSLKLNPSEVSPRVIRVFEAAKKGSNKAVLYGGGIGLLGGAAALAGGVLAGSAAAVAQVNVDATPTPAPAPPQATPTPLTPGTIGQPGFSPAAGSTITGCQSGSSCNLTTTISFLLSGSRDNVEVLAELVTASGQVCLVARSGNVGTLTGSTRTLPNFNSRCAPPFSITGIYVGILSGGSTVLERSFGAGFTFR